MNVARRALVADLRLAPTAIVSETAVAGASACAVVAAVGFSGGGYVAEAWRLGIVALGALAAAALIARDDVRVSRPEWWLVGALSLFAAWTAISGAWSGSFSTSLLEAERGLLYVVGALAVVVGTTRRSLRPALVGAVVGVTAVCAYALAGYVVGPPQLDPIEGRLLFRPVGYANALGIYAAIGVVLSIGLALRARGVAVQAATLAPTLVLVPALYLTQSRGAWLALAAGLATAVWASGRVRVRAAVAVPVVGASLVAAALLGSSHRERLSLAGDQRPQYWEVAWADARAHPVLGSGAGTYGEYWLTHAHRGSFARNAHNLYLETLAELGPLGLLVLVAALSPPLVALVRRRDPAAAAAGGAYVAFLLHAAVDWDWQIPAVTLLGILGGTAVLASTRPATGPLSRASRSAVVTAALVVAAVAAARVAHIGG